MRETESETDRVRERKSNAILMYKFDLSALNKIFYLIFGDVVLRF